MNETAPAWPRCGIPFWDIVPSCTICAALARSGAIPTCVCAKRDKRVEFTLMPEWMATRILALLLGLSGGFAAHYTLLVLGVIH